MAILKKFHILSLYMHNFLCWLWSDSVRDKSNNILIYTGNTLTYTSLSSLFLHFSFYPVLNLYISSNVHSIQVNIFPYSCTHWILQVLYATHLLHIINNKKSRKQKILHFIIFVSILNKGCGSFTLKSVYL